MELTVTNPSYIINRISLLLGIVRPFPPLHDEQSPGRQQYPKKILQPIRMESQCGQSRWTTILTPIITTIQFLHQNYPRIRCIVQLPAS